MASVIASGIITAKHGPEGILIGPLSPPVNSQDSVTKSYVDEATANLLKYMGTFQPSGGTYPAAAAAGNYWVAVDQGIVGGVEYFVGDWAVYNGTSFDRVSSTAVATYLATWPGSTNIITVGTITSGEWHGTRIDETHGGTGSVSGILKQTAGVVSAAQADVDYATPSYVTSHISAIPDASASVKGLVTTSNQTIAGDKTINGTLTVARASDLSKTSTFSVEADGSMTVTAPSLHLGTVSSGVWQGTKIDETHGGAGAVSGILKQTAGVVGPAAADVDYATPSYVTSQFGNIPDASATVKGLVNTSNQTFAGNKTINGNLVVANSADPSKQSTFSVDGLGTATITAPIVQLGTPVWNDLQLLSSIRAGGTAPTFTTFLTFTGGYPLYLYSFNVGDTVYFSGQMPHNWVINSLIRPHVHIAPATDMGATSCNWRMVYTVTDKLTTPVSTTPTDNQTSEVSGLTARQPTFISFPSNSSGKLVTGITGSSALIFGVLTRIASTGSEYGAGVFLLGLDFHIQLNKLNGDEIF